MIRLFVGIQLPHEIRADLLRLQTGIRAAHWQSDDQLHLTLAFIGEVDGGVARDIDLALLDIQAPAFDVHFSGAGLFGTMEKPRILWANAEPRAPLIHLHEKVVTAMRRIGVTIEKRKFVPHATLARIGNGQAAASGVAQFLAAHGALSTKSFPVSEFTLFSSQLTDRGSIYRVEATYPLRQEPEKLDTTEML